jgi:uncharacterized MnhB-related membrane protein
MKPLHNLVLWAVLAAVCAWAWLALLQPDHVLTFASLAALC